MKKISVFLVLVICMTILFGCDKIDMQDPVFENNSSFMDNTTSEGQKVIKNLVLPYNENNTLNPILVTDNLNSQMLKLVFESLLEYDENYKPVLVLAKEYNNSGSKYTFKIDTTKTFHGGEKLTAYDIEYSFDVARRNSDSIYHKNFKKIKSYNAVSNDEFVVKFYEDYPECLNLLNIPIIKKDSSNNDYMPNGTGKYKFVREKERDYLKAVSNDEKIKEISLFTPKNNDTYESCFETGIVNVMYSDMDSTDNMGIGGNYSIKEYTQNKLTYLEFNSSNLLLQDKILRKAISISCDREYFKTNLLLSHAKEAYSLFNPTWYEYSQIEHEKEEYSISKSADLLLANEYTLKDGNFYKGDSKLTFRLLVNSSNEIKLGIAEKLKADFAILGIELIVAPQPYETYKAMLLSKNFDIAICETSIDADMDIKPLIDGNKNYGGFYSEELTEAYENFEKDNGKIGEFLKVYDDFLPKIPLFYRNGGLFLNGRIKGNVNPTSSNCFFEFSNWSIE